MLKKHHLAIFLSGAMAVGPLDLLPRIVNAEPSAPRFAVAAQDEQAARAVMETLEQGGSAVDAAIAGSAALGVVAPVSCGIGGGGFALVYDAVEKKVSAFDYREVSPARYDLGTYKSKDPGGPIGIPGEVAGLVELHRRWGKRSFADDMAPAVRLAENGFVVSKHVADMLADSKKSILNTPLGMVFAPGGVLARAKDRITHPALAATLRRIGVEGSKAFYEGPVAAEIVATAQAAGSPIALTDLASYRVVEREPLRAKWEGYDVATMPAPSAGGVLLLETLGMYSKLEISNMGWGTANYIHMLAEAMRGALADRMRSVGDPAFVADKTRELIAPERLKVRRARIGSERTHAAPSFALGATGTTQLVVADAKGNVVSITTTVNGPFGSGVLAPQSGVLLNNELLDFTDPEAAARFGVSPGPNAPRGGARPVSSMTPAIFFRDEAPSIVIGGSGGSRIPINVTQVALCRLVFGKTPEQCVAAPRFLAPPDGPTLSFNPDQLPPVAVQVDLLERGEQIKTIKWEDSTAVQMIAFDRSDGALRMLGAADPRKGGVAIVR